MFLEYAPIRKNGYYKMDAARCSFLPCLKGMSTMETKTKNNPVKLANTVCAVLMLLLFVCQLMPFWSAEGESASIQGYIWFCQHYNGLSSFFKAEAGVTVNDMVLMPVIVVVSSLLGAFLCLWKSKRAWTAICPVICGIAGIVGYLSQPVFRMGNLWWLHLLVSIAVLISAVGIVVCRIKAKPSEA